ncbi:inner membrane protein YhjD [Tsukamurella serpentis]
MLDKYREKWPWFDHVMEAADRYQSKKGDYYGAGITYFSVFALFPLAMLAFSIGGYILVNNQDLLDKVKQQIADAMSNPEMATTINQLLDQAIASRGTVGLIGLLGGLWAGLGWIGNVRVALTEMWDSEPPEQNFVKTKLGDLAALIGLFAAIVVCSVLLAVGSSPLTKTLLEKVGLEHVPGLHLLIAAVTMLVTVFATWVLWTFVIARLPRVSFPWRNALRAGLLMAVVFTAFTQVATLVIGATLRSPAGATFGPVLGIMLFIFFTARMLLFATAWAATDPRNQRYVVPAAPDPVVISPVIRPEADPGRAAVAGAAGLVAGIGLGALIRRRR